MSAITPDTQIRLIKVDLSMDETNQLTFSNATAQANYFLSLTHDDEQDKCTYLRKDGIIRYPKNIDSILKYNYVMYKNNNFSNKWFYAFIENMEFANPNMTDIKIKTDVFQTWQFQITYKRSFVEREHVSNDTVGLHTIPEGLEIGDYITNSTETALNLRQLAIVTASTVGPSDLENYTMNMYNGVPCPVVYCKWEISNDSSWGLPALQSFIRLLNDRSKIEAMEYMFFAPKWLTPNTESGSVYIDETSSPRVENLQVNEITTLNSYTPVNKKLLTYPYCYYGVSNNLGQFNILKPELWSKSDIGGSVKKTLAVSGVLSAGCSIKAYPLAYSGVARNFDEGITVGKYPEISWSNDLYTNWQTQNGINLGGIRLNATEAGMLKGAGSLIAGGALASSGNIEMGGQLLAGGIGSIFNTMQEQYRHSLQPNGVEGSLNTGDVLTALGENGVTIYTITIKQEYAKIIDQYFSMYGYKVNTVKIPNITGRSNWNYVKTIDCNLEGNIPQNDLIELKNIFNRGITLWHNPNTFLDYSQNNPIV